MLNRPQTILFAENDVGAAVPLILGLQDQGYRVLHATNGHRSLQLAQIACPDLVLLDVALPRLDGFAVCRALRRGSTVPIIMFADHGRERERVRGLELGADGYLLKPISFRELLARVRAVLRRRNLNRGTVPLRDDRIVVGDIVLDRAARQVWRAGRLIELRQREYDLLSALMENAGKAVPRSELLDRVWGEDWVGSTRTLDVHIRWLREKLEHDPSAPRYIQTIRGYGHRFLAPDRVPASAA